MVVALGYKKKNVSWMPSVQKLVFRMAIKLVLLSLYTVYYPPDSFSLSWQLFTHASLKMKKGISAGREIMSLHG